MGKYGNGVSMMTAIRNEIQEAEAILKAASLEEDEKERLINIIKEMAYQWCSSNAAFCAFDALLKEMFPADYDKILGTFLHSPTYNNTYMDKMKATFPY